MERQMPWPTDLPDGVERERRAGPMLNLRRIHQFVVLAETLNFRRAAERLHIAQPPLSVSIQKLETELGVRLFERGGTGGVTLTTGGQAALVEARRLLFHNTQLHNAATSAVAGTGGTLRVGFVGSTIHGTLQRVVRQFRAEFPGVDLVLKEGTSTHIMEQVASDELDVGLVRTPLMASVQASLTQLSTESFVAALPNGNPLAHRSELQLEHLAHESFVFYSRADASGLHSMAMLACQLAGFLPRVAQDATQVQTVLALVESGLGVALVPSIAQYTPNPRISYRRIVNIPEAANIGLALAVHMDTPGAAAQHFRDVAVRAIGMD